MHLHCPELLYPSREATMEPDSRDPYEELEGTLDPHRKEERDAAVAEVAARLRGRGVTVTGTEPPDDLANLLTAVERFRSEEHTAELQSRLHLVFRPLLGKKKKIPH